MTSQRGTQAVPSAMAATAWAPPIGNRRSTPSRAQAAATPAAAPPPGRGGEQTTMRSTPATCAGMAVMSTDDG